MHLETKLGVRRIPLKEMVKRVYFDSTDYCEESRIDTQQLINLIKLSGEQKNFVYTNNICRADLIIYRACGHVQSQQNNAISDLKKLLKLKKSKAELIVWGCLPKINPDSLKEFYDGPLIGPEEAWDFFCSYFCHPKNKKFDVYANSLSIHYLSEQMGQEKTVQTQKQTPRNPFEFQLEKLFYFRTKTIKQNMWYIKIVSGCKNSCTFCTDRLAYKSVRSIPIEKIVEQFELGLAKKHRYFYFEGRDLGSYGYDTGTSLTDLLDKIIERNRQADYKIFLNNVSPSTLIDLYPELDRILASKKVIHLGSHIQSGSNRILKLMGKNHSAGKWVGVIKDIQKKYPKIELETSIMVGFPSETDQDFAETVNLLNDVLFDRVAVYKYNERPNLPSLKIKNPVPETTKNQRYNQLTNHLTLFKIKKRAHQPHLFNLTDLNLTINMARILLRKHARHIFRN